MDSRIAVLVFLIGILTVTRAKRDDMSKVKNHVYKMDRDTPPKGPDGGPVKVRLQLDLIDVVQADGSDNQVEVIVWQAIQWSNPSVKWSDKYDVANAHVDAEKIWVPDFTVYNLASPMQLMSPKLVTVSSHGDYVYIPVYRFRFMCDVKEVESSAGANCTIKMGSWVYGGDLVSLEEPTPEYFNLSNYFEGSRYEILATEVRRNVQTYECCSEELYEDITFSFVIKRKGEYFDWLWR